MNDSVFWKGTTYCVLAALAWALIGPVSRVCFAEGMAPTDVAFWRLLISGLCFMVHATLSGGLKPRPRDLACMVFFGAVDVTAVILSLQISIQKSGSALAVILMFTAPAWVALFSRLLFGEGVSPARLVALLLAMLGTCLVCLSGGSMGGEVSYIGLGGGLLCGFCYAFQFLFFAWWKDRYSTQALFAMTFLPAAAVLFFMADIHFVSLKATVSILVLSVLVTYVAYYWYGQSMRYLSPVQAAIIGNLEPVVGTWLSWWLWNEDFSLAGWAGCALVIASVVMLALRK